ncbi:GTPase HflX [Halalkalibacillus sediminis]|uniref:GTPase HflX n=1 Tax=Halalkalibacillus sediminis TaxID=2018042 RepID=A0A2I0QWM1_9BACI|nr:GTPase HflX [Halalkalibacillus sediminis]PKR78699.1 GTPase HflX [Halalkalibacillus sediminis]
MEEQAILVGCQLQQDSDEQFRTSMEELRALAETVDAEIEEVFIQKRDRMHPSLFLGTGKVEEIKEYIEEHEIELIIMNSELTPSQSRNLSNKWNVKLIDRTQLILDIFAMRARTKEGKLQVELAQLQYLLPRLSGQGEALSRLGGGIGTRGPGETKLETDRRHIQRRITDIKQSLDQVVNQRNQYRERRKHQSAFQISIVGYTNAGKSTLFNQLTNEVSLEEDKLFATLDPLTRKVDLPSGFQAIVSDTVGFIQQLPTTLIAAFRSTLEEVTQSDFILLVVDSSDPKAIEQEKTVRKILEELEADHIPTLTVYNKSDLLKDEFFPYSKPNILMTAKAKSDIHRLKEYIEQVVKQEWEKYKVEVAADEGKLLHRIKEQTILSERSFNEDTQEYEVSGFVNPTSPLYHQLTKRVNKNNE